MSMATRAATGTGSASRHEELKRALQDRRDEIESIVREQLHAVREERADASHVRAFDDDGEVSDVDVQQDLELALVQMKLETLRQIDAALDRLDAGRYGRCAECGEEIAASRLKALPFAVRCLDCQEARESDERKRRHSGRGHDPLLDGDARLK
jgi:DnaK suppressor protein